MKGWSTVAADELGNADANVLLGIMGEFPRGDGVVVGVVERRRISVRGAGAGRAGGIASISCDLRFSLDIRGADTGAFPLDFSFYYYYDHFNTLNSFNLFFNYIHSSNIFLDTYLCCTRANMP